MLRSDPLLVLTPNLIGSYYYHSSQRSSLGEFIFWLNKEGVTTSEFLATSVNTNPAVIRKLMGVLKRAGLIEVHPGIAGANSQRNYLVSHCSTFIRQ